jgi:uncharacterized protein (TIGR03435 family)
MKLATLVILCAAAFGQSLPRFEAASVKPAQSRSGRPVMQPSPGGLRATNVTVKMLMKAAYRLDEASMSGGPGWLDTETFDISAKTTGKTDESQLRLMLQSLLADRFQLKVHRETKELSAFALGVAKKNGPDLHLADAPECVSGPCGNFRKSPDGRLTGERVSMNELARFLSGIAGRPVLDRTGLTGVFDLKLQVSRETSESAPDPPGASLFTAVREQLGLKLEAIKAPVEFLVIDGAQKPTAN